MAKILFYTTYDNGLGADRWIIQGYRDAFSDLGHEFLTTESERQPLEQKLRAARPDVFVAPVGDLAARGNNFLDVLRETRAAGTKNFFFVDTYFRDNLDFIKQLERDRLVHIYFGYYAPEIMPSFEEITGRKYHQIPLAANGKLHFPVPPDPAHEADISFIGNRLPTKEKAFGQLLFPLFRKYRVKVYGPGWTAKDKALRLLSGIGRKSRFFGLADWANGKRITVSPEDERKVYSSSKICINIHEYFPSGQSKNFSNEREFKIPACGGFQITDKIVGIERFFAPGNEIVVAENPADWFPKIDFYMKNGAERRRIRENGARRALRDHTYLQRAKTILELSGVR